MVTSEQAFDMLPYAVDIYEKLNIKEYAIEKAQEAKKSGKDANAIQTEVGEDIIKYIVKNSPKVKTEFFSIVAVACKKTLAEVKKQPPAETIKVFMEVFRDKDLLDFFKGGME